MHPSASRGRVHPEPDDPHRSVFERDRDRIVHSTAFRRLEYKTQVFLNHEGDLFRTRLTHSLEVAQIARSVARRLRLNEDLTESVCLAHDLGHTPFGHAGQEALNAALREFAPDAGGFEHNLQSLRVVDELEERYGAFNGLNLCFETRQGILKHCSQANAVKLGAVAQHHLNNTAPSLEAQLANVCDEIAYNNHDVDDGLRSGLITPDQIEQVTLFAHQRASAQQEFAHLSPRRILTETNRRMINAMIRDLIEATALAIEQARINTAQEATQAGLLVQFSPQMREQLLQLKQFLHQNLYRHHQVMRTTGKAKRIVHELFAAFFDEPRLLPAEHYQRSLHNKARAIADYIAGMTDRFAIKEHRRLFSLTQW